MSSVESTRRDFLKASTSTAGAVWLALHWPAVLSAASAAGEARAAGAGFAHLSVEEARDLDAITAQIIPTDESPGAREAGVVYFIDAALGSFMAANASALRDGLAALNAKARAAHPEAAGFGALADDAQVSLLEAEQSSAFFQDVHFLTLAGMFALPSYGGNRDGVGWKLLGFDHQHVWAPPFGHYDAQAAQAGDDDGKS